MLLKPSRWAQAKSRQGRESYGRAPCPDAVVVGPTRNRIHASGHSIGVFARLDLPSKCFSNSHRRLAIGSVYEWPRRHMDCGRISTRCTRSSFSYDSHDEAPSVDDGCCSANSSGDTRVYLGVRASEALYQDLSSPRKSAGTMARTLSSSSCVVLAGGHNGRNRMASSWCVSVRHAFARDSSFGGPVFSGRWPLVLVARYAVSA